jgi:hypothetical protein
VIYQDQPKHEHDCSKCLFQGHYDGADWYICLSNGPQSVIKRYSSDTPDYWSMPFDMVTSAAYETVAKGVEGHYMAMMELAEARAIVAAWQKNCWEEQYALSAINNEHATSG